jgi:hypothetical protein
MENTEAKRKLRILTFWEKHGLLATLDAFEVSRRTLYNSPSEATTMARTDTL